jgi:hypothetical protein
MNTRILAGPRSQIDPAEIGKSWRGVEDCMLALGWAAQAAELIVTPREIEMLQLLLAACVCYRCKINYRDHGGADHLFFEFPEDLPPEESN